MASFNEDVTINANLTVLGTLAGNVNRSSLILTSGAVHPLDFDRWRVWDAAATLLPGTPAADDLGITTPTFGSAGGPYISTGDVKALGTTTRRARCVFQVPHNHVAGQAFTLRFYAGMLTTVAATSCTIDCEVFMMETNTSYVSGTDIVSTAAINMNSLTFAARNFALDTTAGYDTGSLFDIRITITAIDAATATAVIGAIARAEAVFSVRG